MAKKSYLLTDSVKVTFKDNLFIHLIGRRGPTSGVHMTYQLYLKHKSAGYKVEIENDEDITESITIEESTNNLNKEYTVENGILHVSGEIPTAQEAIIPLAESINSDNIEGESNQSITDEDNVADDSLTEEVKEKTYSTYSKTQLKKMDKDTLISYIETLPEGLLSEESLSKIYTLDKSELVNLIITSV